MKQGSKRLMSVGLALLMVVVGLVLLFDLVEPEYGNFQTLKAQLEGQQAFFQQETNAVAQAKQLISQYQGESGTAQTVALAMPTGEDLSGALAQIYGLASNSGILVQSVGVSAPALQQQKKATSSVNIIQPIGTITFQISAIGSYESFKNFISGLETNVRVFDIKSFSIAPVNASGKSQNFFNGSLTVTVYYQNGNHS